MNEKFEFENVIVPAGHPVSEQPQPVNQYETTAGVHVDRRSTAHEPNPMESVAIGAFLALGALAAYGMAKISHNSKQNRYRQQ